MSIRGCVLTRKMKGFLTLVPLATLFSWHVDCLVIAFSLCQVVTSPPSPFPPPDYGYISQVAVA